MHASIYERFPDSGRPERRLLHSRALHIRALALLLFRRLVLLGAVRFTLPLHLTLLQRSACHDEMKNDEDSNELQICRRLAFNTNKTIIIKRMFCLRGILS